MYQVYRDEEGVALRRSGSVALDDDACESNVLIWKGAM
jgi:hypothetical protein